jgi:hypothetical protein
LAVDTLALAPPFLLTCYNFNRFIIQKGIENEQDVIRSEEKYFPSKEIKIYLDVFPTIFMQFLLQFSITSKERSLFGVKIRVPFRRCIFT